MNKALPLVRQKTENQSFREAMRRLIESVNATLLGLQTHQLLLVTWPWMSYLNVLRCWEQMLCFRICTIEVKIVPTDAALWHSNEVADGQSWGQCAAHGPQPGLVFVVWVVWLRLWSSTALWVVQKDISEVRVAASKGEVADARLIYHTGSLMDVIWCPCSKGKANAPTTSSSSTTAMPT